ncbi:hypothetical protein F4860DRAFT_52442 [Xylaria cubensis]|nr:hypothetical protein F4860DRAFT_52442 [Xylaria cubensis]
MARLEAEWRDSMSQDRWSYLNLVRGPLVAMVRYADADCFFTTRCANAFLGNKAWEDGEVDIQCRSFLFSDLRPWRGGFAGIIICTTYIVLLGSWTLGTFTALELHHYGTRYNVHYTTEQQRKEGTEQYFPVFDYPRGRCRCRPASPGAP